MVDKKKLREQYRNTKPEMGVCIVKSKSGNTCLVQESKDLKSTMNRLRFQLDLGSLSNRDLQAAWKRDGTSAFMIEVLEILPYDEDESKIDYHEELEILKVIWEERLADSGLEFYRR